MIKNRIAGKTSLVARIFAMCGVAALVFAGMAGTGAAVTGLVAEWHFDGNAQDSSGNGNHGTIHGATFVQGISGQALSFNGISDYVDFGNGSSLNFGTGYFSLSAWIKTTAMGNADNEVVIYFSGSNGYYYFGIHPGNPNPHGASFIINNGHAQDASYGTTNLFDGKWHNIVFTRDATSLKVFTDGIQEGSQPSSGLDVGTGTTTISTKGGSWFNGLIDEVRIYNRALSASEILANYNAIAFPSDTVVPTISISSPSNGQSFTTNTITVSGTASDNVALSKVEVKVNTGSWQLATGTNSWSAQVTLSQGSNTITARATDTSGNIAEASATVSYSPPSPTAIFDPTGDIFIWSSGSPTSGPSYIDIVSAEITQGDPTHITLKIKVNGNIPSFGWQGYYFYLDTDRNSGTGFSNIGSNDIGVDYEVGVRGNSGSPPIFAEIRGNGVAQGSGIPITYTISGDTISTTISLADIGNPTSFDWIALTTDGVSINDKAPNSGHSTLSLSPLPTTPPPTTVPPTTVPPTTVPPTTVPPTTVPPTVPPTPTVKPCLTVSQTTLKEEPEVGEEVLITVSIQNTCDGTAKNIRLTEQIPSSISVSFIDGATSNTPNLVMWEGELAPNRAHAITHTIKILEKKGRAIPVIIRYEDEQGNPKESSTTVYVQSQVPVTPTPAQTKAPEPTSGETTVKIPGFTAPLVLIGLVGVILLVRRR